VVGVSSLAYDHLLVPDLAARLRASGWEGRLIVGGVVQAQDLPMLEAAGGHRVFHTGEPLDEVVAAVGVAARSAAEARR
jgi:methylmalonyl-CoA mutase C-terminal domain/subunit